MISIQTLFAKETKMVMMKIVSLQIINYNSTVITIITLQEEEVEDSTHTKTGNIPIKNSYT